MLRMTRQKVPRNEAESTGGNAYNIPYTLLIKNR